MGKPIFLWRYKSYFSCFLSKRRAASEAAIRPPADIITSFNTKRPAPDK